MTPSDGKVIVWFIKTPEEIAKKGGAGVVGIAWANLLNGACVIWTPPIITEDDVAILKHEVAHCQGWTHAKRVRLHSPGGPNR